MAVVEEPVVEVRNLVSRLGGRTVHDGLDLTIPRGALIAIAGGSGSGKTVLLRAMTLLTRPSDGEIRLFGAATDALSARAARSLRRRIGVTFQNGALFTGMTVLENVALPLAEHTRLGRGLIRDIARVKIRLAGLDPQAESYRPAELSGGMVKRAALARALALDPELLFLDEPTAGLDPVSAATFDDLIVKLQQLLGLTVVLVTHDVDSLWGIPVRIAFIGDGRILATGTAAELAASEHPAVSRYFGGARMQRARERTWTHG